MRAILNAGALLLALMFMSTDAVAKSVNVKIKGVDDGVPTNRQQDYKEAVLNAKLQAIARAGFSTLRLARTAQLEANLKQVDAIAKRILLRGYKVVDVGYVGDGSYQVMLTGNIQLIEGSAKVTLLPIQMVPFGKSLVANRFAKVFNRPNVLSSVLGSLEPGTTVYVSGVSKSGTWAALEKYGKPAGYVTRDSLVDKIARRGLVVTGENETIEGKILIPERIKIGGIKVPEQFAFEYVRSETAGADGKSHVRWTSIVNSKSIHKITGEWRDGLVGITKIEFMDRTVSASQTDNVFWIWRNGISVIPNGKRSIRHFFIPSKWNNMQKSQTRDKYIKRNTLTVLEFKE